jgi:protein-arginine kinase activator protein McsA
MRCLKCNKPLTDPISIERGYGPECWAQLGLGNDIKPIIIARLFPKNKKKDRDQESEKICRRCGIELVDLENIVRRYCNECWEIVKISNSKFTSFDNFFSKYPSIEKNK